MAEKIVLDKDRLPCKHLHEESQSHPYGMGSATETWYECDLDDIPEDVDDVEEECAPGKCRHYEPMEVAVCDKHGEYIKDYGCTSCEAEEWERHKAEEQKYYDEMERDMRQAKRMADIIPEITDYLREKGRL